VPRDVEPPERIDDDGDDELFAGSRNGRFWISLHWLLFGSLSAKERGLTSQLGAWIDAVPGTTAFSFVERRGDSEEWLWTHHLGGDLQKTTR